MAKNIYQTTQTVNPKYAKDVRKILKKHHIKWVEEEFDGRVYFMYMTFDWSIQTEVNKATNSRVTLNGKEVTD
jgi:hypothetical protein